MNEREKQFCSELKALLEKDEVEISASDEYRGHPECGEDIRITAYASCKWQGLEQIHGGIDIDFGRYVDCLSVQFS